MAGAPRLYRAVTQSPVVALQGNVENLIDSFEDNFEMAMDYLAVMSQWLLELLERYAIAKAAADPDPWLERHDPVHPKQFAELESSGSNADLLLEDLKKKMQSEEQLPEK